MPKYYLAIDIGASSGRHILGHLEEGKLILEEIYRFDNTQVLRNGHDCWDMEKLWKEILAGLKACAAQGKLPFAIGVDTWGVDYVLLDGEDKCLGDAVAYRDKRTDGMDAVVEQRIAPEELYRRTGIQKTSFNTIYQLAAHQKEHPEELEQARTLLFVPDYIHFLLTGVKANEYTIASTSGLLNAAEKQWDREVLDALELPQKLFGDLAMPGTVLGGLRKEVRDAVGFDAQVILPASHDTGSAFLAIPAEDDNAVYISSGTWSLLGVENAHAITGPESYRHNFTNEGGAWGRYRYLKNIMGLWMIQSIRRELNGVAYIQGKQQRTAAEKQWSFPDLIEAARGAEHFTGTVDVNRQCFMAPDSMIQAIQDECARTGQPIPESVGELMQCVYTSLSACYRDAIANLEELTGKKFTSINIVGGGCQDGYLNRRTAQATGLPVYAGPVEGTAIGNLMVQMIASGDISGLEAGRDIVRNTFNIAKIQ